MAKINQEKSINYWNWFNFDCNAIF